MTTDPATHDAGAGLWSPQRWKWAQVDVQFCSQMPPAELVQSVHLIGFLDGSPDRVVVCREETSPWFLPGGTREPNEPIDACLARELAEEAGATLAGPVAWLGAHVGRGYLDRPYRPHLPHPDKAWLWGVAPVRIVGPPTAPPGAEQVVDVRPARMDDAKALLVASAQWYPELLDLAHALIFGGQA